MIKKLRRLIKTDLNTLTLYRFKSTHEYTLGYISDGHNVICFTLELPWRDNATDISCIPHGTYEVHRRINGRFRLSNVEGRAGIDIHVGNRTKEIQGCILVGMIPGYLLGDRAVLRSKEAMAKLKIYTKFKLKVVEL